MSLTKAQWLKVTHTLPHLQGLEDEHVKTKRKQQQKSRHTLPVMDFGSHLSVFLQNQWTK